METTDKNKIDKEIAERFAIEMVRNGRNSVVSYRIAFNLAGSGKSDTQIKRLVDKYIYNRRVQEAIECQKELLKQDSQWSQDTMISQLKTVASRCINHDKENPPDSRSLQVAVKAIEVGSKILNYGSQDNNWKPEPIQIRFVDKSVVVDADEDPKIEQRTGGFVE